MNTKFLLLLLFVSNCAFAQLQRNYSSYSVDNGLAQNTVWDAFHDYKGYMWFGTADGINRFDGYKMHHYLFEANDSNSIYGTTGFNFFEDSTGRFWVGHDRGLSRYDRVHDNFQNIFKKKGGISILGIDDKGILWTVNAAKYIYGFDQKTGLLKHSVFINQSWHNSYGSVITSVKAGSSFFIGLSENKILCFNSKSLAYNVYSFANNIGTTLLKLSANRFCSFYNKFATICTVVNDSPIFYTKHYSHPDTSKIYFSGGTIYKDKLYAGGANGLFVFEEKTLELEEHITNFTDKKDDSYCYVQTVRNDNNGNLVICTNGAGVYIFSPYRNRFKHYTNYSPKKSLYKAITTTKDGKIVGGTYAEGMTVFTPNGKFKQILPPLDNFNGTIHGIYKITEKELLLSSYYNVTKYNLQTNAFNELPVDKIYHSTAYPCFQNVDGRIWLNRNNTNDAAILDVYSNKKILSIPDNTITCFNKISEQVILLGTVKGLFFYELVTKNIRPTQITDFVKSILITSDNKKIYVGTIVGLYQLNMVGKIVNHSTTANVLKNNFIYGVLEDNHQNIWFSHNRGITMLNPQTGLFKHYSVNDGLQSNEFNTGAYYKDEKGLLYFGGVNGINVIDPDNIIVNEHQPIIGMNEILVNDQPLINDSFCNEIKTLQLSYLENTLSFDFSALEFSQPEKNTYQYKMDGVDENWIESGTRHFARYPNMPPGKYVFKIKAANGDGYWNNTPRELAISIIPPFWQRGWFYILLFLFISSSFVGGIFAIINRQKLRLKRELEVQQKLEQERLRISRDLHDNVGAQLSYLITNVEWMLKHPERIHKEEERLLSLSEAGRNAILTLRQTIWAISKTELNVEEFADRFKQFALKMIEFDTNIQLYFQENFEHNKVLSPAVALNLFRICQEAFNNCLKHAQCTTIHIRFESNNLFAFVFIISDNGVGFDWNEANKKGHYGVLNMQARAKETQAELIVNAKKGHGTTLVLQLK